VCLEFSEEPPMSARNLDKLLQPRSVAVIGASSRPGALGQRVLENVIDGGFEGTIFAVNPKQVELDDEWWVKSVADLPVAPDIAVIVTPAETVPQLLSELGAKGTKLAVILSAGFHDIELRQAMLDAARPHLLRVIGPNCLGVALPHAKLNATFAQRNPEAGGLALISQSGALVTAMIDWATDRGVGFSGIATVGDMADVDLADLVDLFAADPKTSAIALYAEGIGDAAKFMAAARAAARTKPVIILKAGRSSASAAAAISHTAALTGSYAVHEAAFRRAGMISVDSLTELFDAAQVLAARLRYRGPRLAVVSNGGGPGILAADALPDVGGELAQLAPETIAQLDKALPASWSRANPVDVVGDAKAERFAAALRAVDADPGVDAVLVIHCPTALVSGAEIARAVAAERAAGSCGKPLIACWLGAGNAGAARPILSPAAVPLFDNLDDAVRGFGYLIEAAQARASLLRAPLNCPERHDDAAAARGIVDEARAEGRVVLSAPEARKLLSAYGVPFTRSRLVADIGDLSAACCELWPPYAVKIVSPDITHKSDFGGVVLNLADAEAVAEAALAIRERAREAMPGATILGFELQEMVRLPDSRELLVGMTDDPQFGPVIAVGAGGVDVELIRDRVLGLPPLDAVLARDMLDRTRIARLLAAHRGRAAGHSDGVVAVLEAIAAVAADIPDIVELDINPLLVGRDRVVALDARIRISERPRQSRMALAPAPMEWAADLITREGVKLHVRPVLPSDEWALAEFFHHVSSEDKRFRFLSAVEEIGHDRLAAMTQVDYRRSINFLAFAEDGTLVATAMLCAAGDRSRAEFAISIHSDWKKKGISWTLTDHVLRYAKAQGIAAVESLESSDNQAALKLEREFGFTTKPCEGSPSEMLARKELA
jgi:acetyltransferase